MTRNKKLPEPKQPAGSIRVDTYAHLERYVKGFKRGAFGLIIIVGPPGTGKSQIVKRTLSGTTTWIEGSATAFGMYKALYAAKDCPIVIDDVDSLYSDRACVRLLKTLCQSDETKSIAWHSAMTGKADRPPSSFETRSRTIIIANEWATKNQNVVAIQDRGSLLYFAPTNLELHKQVAKWFDDTEIFSWFGRHLNLFPRLSMRMYVVAKQHKQADMSWLASLASAGINKRTLVCAMLREAPRFATERDRVRYWVARGYGSRATYFNHARVLREAYCPDGAKVQLSRSPNLRIASA